MKFLTAETLADGIDAFIYAIDYDTYEILYANQTARELCGNKIANATCYGAFLGLKAPCEECPIQQLREGGNPVSQVRWIRAIERWMQIEYNPIIMNDGRPACVATGVDVTAVQNAADNLKRVLDSINAAAYTVNPYTRRLHSINRNLSTMLPSIKVGDLCYKSLWGNEYPCEFCPLGTPRGKDETFHMVRFNPRLDRHLSIDMSDVTGDNGEPLAVFTAYDITPLVESREKLKQVAFTDSLTGLRNRIAFMNDMTDMFARGDNCCLCVLNIKFLRRYNLLYGKKEGDKLLIRTANLFAMRYQQNRVYRVDGAKVAFLAEGAEQVDFLRHYMVKVEREFHERWGNTSAGICLDKAYVVFPDFAQTPEQAIYNAEYLLKKNGKQNQGKRLEFNKAAQALLMRQNDVEAAVHDVTVEGRFHVYYQPIYDIKQGAYTKCEALIRMHDKKLGWVSPTEFIPLAEEAGTIRDLGKFVRNEVCSMLADRIAAGLPTVRVNVNISPVEIGRTGFYESVVGTAKRWNVPPELIQLEVTESALVGTMENTMEIMRQLIAEGFSFAIDDFGTGYSNLNYIGNMPVECLKLDKSFMDQLLDSASSRLIVTNVIEIAKGLKLSIVAEGIESESQYELIKQLGSDYIQGFLFSRPLPRAEFEAFLNEHSNTKC